ncbi:MAG TPA: cytochrome c biogenesis protein CcsA [Candidatus Ozemobacteraceae bacterium]
MQITLAIAVVALLLAAFFRILERAAGKTPAWHGTLTLWIGLAAAFASFLGHPGAATGAQAGFSLPLALQIAGFVLAAVCAWLEWRSRETFFSLFVLPVSAALLTVAAVGERLLVGTQFRGPWFLLHVGFSIAGECLFFMAALAAITYLIALKRLKDKNRLRAVSFFPPLLRLESLMTGFLGGGCVLFAAGLFGGFAWFWLQFAILDPLEPKKALSSLLLVVFVAILLLRRREKLPGPRFAWSIIAGFLLSMVLTFGIDSTAHWFPR